MDESEEVKGMKYLLSDDWEEVDEIIVYGFGKEAQDNLDFFINKLKIFMIVDGDRSKCGGYYKEIPIVHVENARQELRKYKIIIMTVARNASAIADNLERMGLRKNQDFCSMERFVTEWFWRFKHKVYLQEVHTTITTRCTLNCKYCNMFMPYYKKQVTYSKEEIAADLEALFRHVDYILSYRLLGGEPLLHEDLAEIITYIGEKYKDRIGNIGIITNGMVRIKEELLQAAKKYSVKFEFSDYTNQIPYENMLEKNISIVEKAGIWYERRQSLRWCDFGFPEKSCCYTQDSIREHMLSCGPVFHGLNDKRFYYCHVSWSAEKCGLCQTAPDDYIDLKEDRGGNIKLKILEHSQGNMDKGYVKLCKVCGGCGDDNKIFVAAGEQMGR